MTPRSPLRHCLDKLTIWKRVLLCMIIMLCVVPGLVLLTTAPAPHLRTIVCLLVFLYLLTAFAFMRRRLWLDRLHHEQSQTSAISRLRTPIPDGKQDD